MPSFRVIPTPYIILGVFLALSIAAGGIYYKGLQSGIRKGEVAIAEYKANAVEKVRYITQTQVKVEEKIVVKYVNKIVKVKDVGDKNAQDAKTNVPDNTILSNGWLHNHNASARGDYADPTSSADGTPSGVEANRALAVVNENYAICRKEIEKLKDLQTWVIETKKNIDAQNQKNKGK